MHFVPQMLFSHYAVDSYLVGNINAIEKSIEIILESRKNFHPEI
jgi:hypothetical protein